MAAKEVKGAAVADEVVVSESHYHSKKDRVFVRAIAGPYNLKDELARLRAMPRVRKEAATSKPMKLAPTTTTFFALLALATIALLSANERRK